MFKKLVSKIVGDPNQKIINDLRPLVNDIGSLEPELQELSDEQLRERSLALRRRFEEGEPLDGLLPEAFALVREASVRTIGLRHYDVQLMGGTLLHRGDVVEMRTGEGKTLVATLPLYLNALTGDGVHLVTVNEYLAKRDGGWMGNIFHFLGLSTSCIGTQQFSAIFDPDYVNPGAELEDERLVHWRPCSRHDAYEADITYGISSEFGFDYLRDNMAPSRHDQGRRHGDHRHPPCHCASRRKLQADGIAGDRGGERHRQPACRQYRGARRLDRTERPVRRGTPRRGGQGADARHLARSQYQGAGVRPRPGRHGPQEPACGHGTGAPSGHIENAGIIPENHPQNRNHPPFPGNRHRKG